MKSKHGKLTFSQFILLTILATTLNISRAIEETATTKPLHQGHSKKNFPISRDSNKLLGPDVNSQIITSHASRATEENELPESEEAKQDRLADISNKKAPMQRMRNDNFSNIDDNYRRILNENERHGSLAKSGTIFYKTNNGDVSNLLGSIEESVRNDVFDISPHAKKEIKMDSYEELNKKLKPGRVNQRTLNQQHNIGTQRVQQKGLKEGHAKLEKSQQKSVNEMTSGKNISMSLSAKKVESSLSNEGRKKTNENKIIYDGNYMEEKKLEGAGSGVKDKESDEWGESGSGNSYEVDDYHMSKQSLIGNQTNRKANGDRKKILSFREGAAKIQRKETQSYETIKEEKATKLTGKQQEPWVENGSSDDRDVDDDINDDDEGGDDDDHNHYQTEDRIGESYKNDDEVDVKSDKEANLEGYSNQIMNKKGRKQGDEFSGSTNKWENWNENTVEDINKSLYGNFSEFSIKTEDNQSDKTERVQSEDYPDDYNNESNDNDYNDKNYDVMTSGESSSGEQMSGEQPSGEGLLNEKTSGNKASAESIPEESLAIEKPPRGKTTGERISDKTMSVKQTWGEASSGQINSSSQKNVQNVKEVIEKAAVNYKTAKLKSKSLSTEETDDTDTSSGSGELVIGEAKEDISTSGSGQDGFESSGKEKEESNLDDSTVKKWHSYTSNIKEEPTRVNSKSHEGIVTAHGELRNASYQGFLRTGEITVQNFSNKAEGILTHNYSSETGERKTINSSSTGLPNYSGSNTRNNTSATGLNDRQENRSETIKGMATDNYFHFTSNKMADNASIERVKIENLLNNATELGQGNNTADEKEDEKTIQELNKEIRDEEDKSKAMINYLEKIDKELGLKTNESAEIQATLPNLKIKQKDNLDLSSPSYFPISNISSQSHRGIVMESNKSQNLIRSEENGITNNNVIVEYKENLKEDVPIKQNFQQLQRFPSNNKTTVYNEPGKQKDEDMFINKVIKGIFGDVEKMIEGKLEEIMDAKSKTSSSRNTIFNKENSLGKGPLKVLEKGPEKTHFQKSNVQEAITENKKYEGNENRLPISNEHVANKGVIVIDLHEKSKEGNDADKSKRTERPTIDGKSDAILNYKRTYGANSTLVVDFSKGEAGAKLYIIPKNTEENAQKKNVVAKTEAGEKRSKYGVKILLFFSF